MKRTFLPLLLPVIVHSTVAEGLASVFMGLLTEHSGSPLVQSFEGRTTVHCATYNESINGPELNLLLDHNGDSNLTDNDG